MLSMLLVSCLFFGADGMDPACVTIECYEDRRAALVSADQSSRIGGSSLTPTEQQVGLVLDGLRGPFLGQMTENFRLLVPKIKASALYPLIQQMPKGALLHSHGIHDMRWLVQNATYRSDCFVDLRNSSETFGMFAFQYLDRYTNTVQGRSSYAQGPVAFDDMLYNLTQFFTPSWEEESETAMWTEFNKVIERGSTLTGLPDICRASLLHSFQLLVDEGVSHLELRIVGVNADSTEFILNVLEEFNAGQSDPDLQLSLKIISCDLRNVSLDAALNTMTEMLNLKQNETFRDVLTGYDLVGEEDLLNRLEFYAPAFLKAEAYAKSLNQTLEFYFHCAETDNATHGSSNLFDAVLLGSKRLGHALGLRDHPLIQQIVNTSGIGLEICPVSNQMLRYFSDFRTHPAVSYIESGLPVTLSSDDPSIYGYESAAPTYDFFVAWTSWNLSFESLKQIAKNSLLYSALSSDQKTEKLAAFERRWSIWMANVLKKEGLKKTG